jgi:hypothetical protein
MWKKTNANKLLVSALLFGLLCAPMLSMALATPDDDSSVTDDDQMLISPTPEDETSTSDENPVLIQQRDTDTNATDSTPTEGQSEDEPNLIATNTASDNTVLVAGTIALVAGIVLVASLALTRRRKK